jgi:hypothetical protein
MCKGAETQSNNELCKLVSIREKLCGRTFVNI